MITFGFAGIVSVEGVEIESREAVKHHDDVQNPKVSYKETLAGRARIPEDVRLFQQELDEMLDEEEMEKGAEEVDCPIIRLSKEERAIYRMPWRKSLIIKVWGRTVGHTYLLRRL